MATGINFVGIPPTDLLAERRRVLDQQFRQIQEVPGYNPVPKLWQALALMLEQAHEIGMLEQSVSMGADIKSVLDLVHPPHP